MRSSNRIALFIPSLRGGAERVMSLLADGLADKGMEVDLVVGTPGTNLSAEDLPEVRMISLNSTRIPLAFLGLLQYLRREHPRTIISALDHVNVATLWARRVARVDTRVVISVHNTLSVHLARSRYPSAKVLPMLIRHCYPWADEIIAVSNGVADDLTSVANLDREEIRVIYNPVVTPELVSMANAPLCHPWFGLNKPPVILSVGRLTAQKDFSTLIKAFSKLRRARASRLLIIGEGEERGRLQSLIDELGLEHDACLPGRVDNVYSYMSRSSVFALSSEWEGLPSVLIEALALGIPVVSTDCRSGPNEILDGGRYGKLVPIGDSVALADALGNALDNREDVNVLKSRAETFTVERAVSQYMEVV